MKNILTKQSINLFKTRNETLIGNLSFSEMTIKRKAVTFRLFLNRLLRKPRRIRIERLSTGIVIETQFYNNTQIIKVYN